jgi:hypothetical protein
VEPEESDKILQQAKTIHAENTGENERATQTGGSLNFQKVEALLDGMNLVQVSSKASTVELRRFELLTSSMRTKRSTN